MKIKLHFDGFLLACSLPSLQISWKIKLSLCDLSEIFDVVFLGLAAIV